MEHRKELEELHKKSLEKLDLYLKTRGKMSETDSARVHEAKKEWQESWNKFMEVLVYLESFEL